MAIGDPFPDPENEWNEMKWNGMSQWVNEWMNGASSSSPCVWRVWFFISITYLLTYSLSQSMHCTCIHLWFKLQAHVSKHCYKVLWFIHRESKKSTSEFFLPQLHQTLTDIGNSFAGTPRRGKFLTNWSLGIPPHLKCVATLPCEILISENKRAPCLAGRSTGRRHDAWQAVTDATEARSDYRTALVQSWTRVNFLDPTRPGPRPVWQ